MSPVEWGVRQYGRALALAASPRLSILIFHRVLPETDPLLAGVPDAAQFEARVRWLGAAFRILPLLEAARRLADGTLPANAACITFDDGYADNLTVAAPILVKLRVPATFFVTTGFLDGGRMWNDTVIEAIRAVRTSAIDLTSIGLGAWPCATTGQKVAAIDGLLGQLKYLPQAERQERVDAVARVVGQPLPDDLMMTRRQVAELRRHGMSIGGHTVTHPILTKIAVDDARREIDDGRRDLEDVIGEPVRSFAYPNGVPNRDYDARHVAMVKELGFSVAVSTSAGISKRRSDPLQLARFTPWDAGVNRFGLRLAGNLTRHPQVA